MKTLSTIDLTYENQYIKQSYFDELGKLYDSNMLMASPVMEELEKHLAERCGTKHCALTGSGTMALQVAALAIGIKPGDEIIIPANTFFATATALARPRNSKRVTNGPGTLAVK